MKPNDIVLHLKVTGEFACFTNPLLKVERVSYPVPTPSACRGILESIMFKPEFRYEVVSVTVKKPIRYQSLRRNEIKSIVTRNLTPIQVGSDRTQRNTLALRDVEYIIGFRIVFDGSAIRTDGVTDTINTPEKYYSMFVKYAERGHIRRQPCLGCKEFICNYELVSYQDSLGNPAINPDQDFGFMIYDLYDLDKHNSSVKVTVFDSKLRGGVVHFPPWSEVKSKYAAQFNQ